MNNLQSPLGSGFNFHSTTDDVIAGIDLTGKLAVITGGYSGLGLETTRALSRAGAHVVVAARRPEVASEALLDLPGIEIETLDLSYQSSVRDFAERFRKSGRKADLVINNAAVMACPEARVGKGWESQFGTNHLGHYSLINLILPSIAPGARIVVLSSAGHQHGGMRWDDIQFESGYDKWLAYGQSKTANALFAVHLDKLLVGKNIRAFSVHPGKIITPLQRHLAHLDMVADGWIDEQGNCIDPTFKTPIQGAATQVWVATSTMLKDLGGVYCEDCDVAALNIQPREDLVGVNKYAVDIGDAARLWKLSAEMTGIDAFSQERNEQ